MTDPFFDHVDDLTTEQLIERVNRNREETDQYNQGQLDE